MHSQKKKWMFITKNAPVFEQENCSSAYEIVITLRNTVPTVIIIHMHAYIPNLTAPQLWYTDATAQKVIMFFNKWSLEEFFWHIFCVRLESVVNGFTHLIEVTTT